MASALQFRMDASFGVRRPTRALDVEQRGGRVVEGIMRKLKFRWAWRPIDFRACVFYGMIILASRYGHHGAAAPLAPRAVDPRRHLLPPWDGRDVATTGADHVFVMV